MFYGKLKERNIELAAKVVEFKFKFEESERNYNQMLIRCRMLEDAFKKDQGISIRQEITNVIVNFDKVEMCVMLAALNALLSNKGTKRDEAEYCLSLMKKIEGFVQQMKEDQPERKPDDRI